MCSDDRRGSEDAPLPLSPACGQVNPDAPGQYFQEVSRIAGVSAKKHLRIRKNVEDIATRDLEMSISVVTSLDRLPKGNEFSTADCPRLAVPQVGHLTRYDQSVRTQFFGRC